VRYWKTYYAEIRLHSIVTQEPLLQILCKTSDGTVLESVRRTINTWLSEYFCVGKRHATDRRSKAFMLKQNDCSRRFQGFLD